MLLRVGRRFAGGLMLDTNYTLSKEIDDTDTVEDNQGFNAGRQLAQLSACIDPKLNRRLGYSDMPHRFVGTFLYELPFGRGTDPGHAARAAARSSTAGSSAASVIWQTGFPIGVTGASTGAALARPDRVDGVDIVLPENLLGLVRRPDGGDAPERPVHDAAGAHLPQVQPRRLRRPRRDDPERPHRRRSVLVRQRGA